MGKFIIISAPSGAGKSTIIQSLSKEELLLSFSISACNRSPRTGEQHQRDYYFLSTEDFKQKIEQDAFVEWEEVYDNHYYGTLKSEIEKIFSQGKHVIFDVDVAGALRLKKIYGNDALAIFIMPPSIEELEKRLKNRATDSIENIKKRVEKAKHEISFAKQFDKVLVNDNLIDAIKEAEQAIQGFLQKSE